MIHPGGSPRLRGWLYDDGYQPKLSGHETFPLRYGWLKKALDAVAAADATRRDTSIFLADDAIARFGVGKNMVASIRHWAVAAGMIEESAGRIVPTPLGSRLFGAGGLDPYMEDPATAWLVQWRLCGHPRKTTWFWAFNHCPAASFDRDLLVNGIETLAKHRGWARAATATIKNDVACFIRTYVSQSPAGKASHEETLESPFDRARFDSDQWDGGTGTGSSGAQADARRRRFVLCGDELLVALLHRANPGVRSPGPRAWIAGPGVPAGRERVGGAPARSRAGQRRALPMVGNGRIEAVDS